MIVKYLTTLLLALVVVLASPLTAEAHHLNKGRTPCLKKYNGVRTTKCFIKRAAEHFDQSVGQAKATAWCESRYDPFASSNPPYVGLYQFDKPTWKSAPWHKKSRTSARYSALNAMWYWKIGDRDRWPVCG